jgi:alpha-beta hydrolase superfamily lysophospholipase
MPHHEDQILAADGASLYYQGWLPEVDARAAIVAVHGFTEHGGRYAHIAERLNQRGYAVYAMDLRGHGRSEGPRCFIRSFDQHLDDFDRMLANVRRREPGKPIFLFGHSMGGLIVTLYTIRRQPEAQGLIVSAAVLRIGDKAFPWLRHLAGAVGCLLPNLRVVRLGARYLARDPQAAADYVNDPLVFHGRFPARAGAEMLRAAELARGQLEAVRLPLLVLHGTADVACDCEGSRELYRRAASADRTLRLYDGFYHAIFWEQDRERVIGDLVEWLDARVPQPEGRGTPSVS